MISDMLTGTPARHDAGEEGGGGLPLFSLTSLVPCAVHRVLEDVVPFRLPRSLTLSTDVYRNGFSKFDLQSTLSSSHRPR